ncbi:UDP-glycosyltransferase UGT5-like [Episyrphus balteatus]|uniref:UDP-glycosyltransferase UGT5-like n=1 Tax=Episyrphus balteatus TaxID=286459 RepID=UPI002484FB84|nr:UDP-glycosyltransferase UGT5-like [Episyrphus balteatus]
MANPRCDLIVASFVILTTFCVVSDSARILGLFPTPMKSHLIIHSAIAEALAERGHDVTVVSSHPPLKKNLPYRYIQLSVPGISSNVMAEAVNNPPPWYKKMFFFLESMNHFANASLHQPPLQKLMKEESFDLVVHGYFFNEFLLGVSAHFKCPVVMSFTIQTVPNINNLVGNPQEKSYVPTVMAGGKQPLGFWERVKNFLFVGFLEEIALELYLYWAQTELYQANFPSDKYPSLADMKKNISLIMTNHHFSQKPIRPNVPGLVEVGGIQIKSKPDPLPEDIKEILGNSTQNGVIYFSLGTNIHKSHLDSSKVKIIFEVLSKLPQKVLWKWGDSEVPGESPNIFFKKWLPQDDILAHPNVRLFITHGGQGSVVESQYHGVPMVGIPLFSEQGTNVGNLVKEGFGLGVDYATLTHDEFSKTVNEVLTNNRYRDNVQRFARIYKDRPMTAKETAVYWVEYVLRHRGAPHMQSPAIHLNHFQLMSLDVIGFFIVVAYVSFKIVKILFKLEDFIHFLCVRSESVILSGKDYCQTVLQFELFTRQAQQPIFTSDVSNQERIREYDDDDDTN